MRKKNYVLALSIILFMFSFCTQDEKKPVAASAKAVKEKYTSQRKCCTSNLPARFSIKNSHVAQPVVEK